MKWYWNRMRGPGKCPPRKALPKIAWSLIGAFLGIYLVCLCGQHIALSPFDCLFLIGSFGASAVLIYGAPGAELSQPRNLVGGHVVSALVGVTIAQFLSAWLSPALTCAGAVSLAVAAMHLTRTLHPPGGATALIAVTGGPQIQGLGYFYVLSPVLCGTLIMLVIALLVNNLSSNPKRHYPHYWF